jgi:SAM-dependent methyltransferase
MPTAYDTVRYPSTIHKVTHPERLAVAARLAGLDPAPMARARVLEIGGGDCLGLIAFAAAWPESRCCGFDLAASTIARGREIAGQAVPNVALEVADILTAHELYAAGAFDYVIAHGVYAWVPAPVREALMALIAHVLAPDGVALVSYNAMPGGHIRLLLRDMVLHAVDGITDPDKRLDSGRAFLADYATPRDDDNPLDTGLRLQARSMADRPGNVLIHDEMGDCFAPQSLSQVVAAAGRVGLRFLTDAGPNRGLDGFLRSDAPASDDPDRDVLRQAQAHDYANLAFFRTTLLVHAHAPLDRQIRVERLAGLWTSARFKPLGNGQFSVGQDNFAIADAGFAEHMAALAQLAPGRMPVVDVVADEGQALALIELCREWFADLHLGPPPFAVVPGPRPRAGALIRQTIARGEYVVATLAHTMLRLDQPALHSLLLAADGTRTTADLVAIDHGLPAGDVPAVLAKTAQMGLLVA